MGPAADIVRPLQKHLFSKSFCIKLFYDMEIVQAEHINSSVMKEVFECVFYSIAIDGSSDITDTAQLAVFIRGINDTFKISLLKNC